MTTLKLYSARDFSLEVSYHPALHDPDRATFESLLLAGAQPTFPQGRAHAPSLTLGEMVIDCRTGQLQCPGRLGPQGVQAKVLGALRARGLHLEACELAGSVFVNGQVVFTGHPEAAAGHAQQAADAAMDQVLLVLHAQDADPSGRARLQVREEITLDFLAALLGDASGGEG